MKDVEIAKLKEILPNRYPYLMIDYALEIVSGKSAKAYKNLTANEWFFPVHFPEEPMMPGMIQMEALLQTLSLPVLVEETNKNKQIRMLSANKIRLKKRVVPGSRMIIEAEILTKNDNEYIGVACGIINNEEVCSAEFVFLAEEVRNE